VVFYKHAWLGHRNENVAQLQDLASRGFVIVATDHPGQAKRVLYQDGTVIHGSSRPVPRFFERRLNRVFRERGEDPGDQRFLEIERVRTAFAGGLVPGLDGKVRWTRMGVFGFFFGKTTSIQLSAVNSGFIAGANQDGLYLEVGEPRGPFLFFDQGMPQWLLEPAGTSESAGTDHGRRAEVRTKHAMAANGRLRKILPGPVPASFTDRKFLSPLRWSAEPGNAGPKKSIMTSCRHWQRFFKRTFGI